MSATSGSTQKDDYSTMAHKVKSHQIAAGGLEGLFDLAAMLVVAIGVTVAVVVLIWNPGLGIPFALGTLFNAAIAWLLLRGFAEVIRLLKQLNGLPFDGRISGGDREEVFRCSKCQSVLHSDVRCDGCGETIEL